MRKLFFLFLCIWTVPVLAGEHASCPYHSEHQARLDQTGDHVMGFDHTKTTHHFLLKSDGGVILADAIDEKDQQSIEQIRTHFVEIATKFSQGDFSKAQEIHGKVPPGSPEMTKLKDRISYQFQKRENGGEVRITTKDEQALKAIHTFLRFQIEEHRTGDPAKL